MAVNGDAVIHISEDGEGSDSGNGVGNWKESLMKKLFSSPRSELGHDGFSIPRVPDAYLESYKKSYYPKIVSIGPYHRGKRQLQAMEEEKILCLRELLQRSPTTLDDCIDAMRSLEERARTFYQDNIDLPSYDFVEMMMLDAAFLIVKFLNLQEANPSYLLRREANRQFIFALIKRDMLLLENQLPFFVLHCLFDLTFKTPPSNNLISLAINFLNHPEETRQSNPPEPNTVHHLLHLYQLQCYSNSSIFITPKLETELLSPFPGATKLKAMGVQFGLAPPESIITDVTFGHDQVMKIPHLLISEYTVALFLNLIAFEQFNLNMRTDFTCYAAFMSHMLSDSYDVEFLSEIGIIENSLGSHQEVVNIFKSMRDAVVVDPSSSIANTFRRVSKFSQSEWRILKVILKGSPWWSNYFSDPVTLSLTLVGGVGLWLLTALQTFYAVYSYYHPS